INSNYEKHSRAALDIAREYFDAGKVLGRLVECIGLSPAAHRSVRPSAVREQQGDPGVDERQLGPRELVETITDLVKSGDGAVGRISTDRLSGSRVHRVRVDAGEAARSF